jgi:hypothetical protein
MIQVVANAHGSCPPKEVTSAAQRGELSLRPCPYGTNVSEDLDLLMITGAGASCAFGAPLMSGWSEALVAKLSTVPSYREATGLSTGLRPEEFEERLGRFLHQVQAFDEVESLMNVSTRLQPSQGSLAAEGVLSGWHSTTAFHLHAIVEKIR